MNPASWPDGGSPSPAPIKDAATEWEQLMHRRHDPLAWRRIFDAVDHADRRAGTAERGGQAWCRVAVAAVDLRPNATAENWYGDRIDVNPGLWWRWLTAPVVNVDGPLNVADLLDLTDHAGPPRPMGHETVRGLIHGAASAGLFGVAGATIEVHPVLTEDEARGLILVTRASTGTGVATPVITGGLPPHPCGDRIADALAVLTTAADHINSTLDKHDAAVRSAAHGVGPAQAARAFPPLGKGTPTRPAATALPAGPTAPHGRSR